MDMFENEDEERETFHAKNNSAGAHELRKE